MGDRQWPDPLGWEALTQAEAERDARRARGYYSDRAIRERRAAAKRCICPSHASNRGECPVHDAQGHVRDWLTPFDGSGIDWHESLPSPYTYQESDFSKLVAAVHEYEAQLAVAERERDAALEALQRLLDAPVTSEPAARIRARRLLQDSRAANSHPESA